MVEYPHAEPPTPPPEKPKRKPFGRNQIIALVIVGIPLVIATLAWLVLDAMDADQWIGLTSALVEWGVAVTLGGGALVESARAFAGARHPPEGAP